MAPTDTPAQKSRFGALRRVTLTGSVVNLGVSIAQIAGGFIFHSQALAADGFHTLSDLVSDAVVLLAAKHGSQDADEDHPYGHRRIETLGSVVVGLALMGVSIAIAIEGFDRLLHPGHHPGPVPIALAFAALAIIAKESLYHYTMHVAKQVKSNLLKANAWHHRSDVFSSLVVFAGIGGALLGFKHLDAIAAIVVSTMIFRIGWKLSASGIQELIDTGLETEEVQAIRQSILEFDGVKNLHTLRTRRMGGEALADVHIQVDPTISVSEGHHIGEAVRFYLITQFENISDVTVHIDPEDDELEPSCVHLPLRKALLAKLKIQWSDIKAARELEDIHLHYLNGQVHLDLFLPFRRGDETAEEASQVADKLVLACKSLPEIGEVKVYFRCDRTK